MWMATKFLSTEDVNDINLHIYHPQSLNVTKTEIDCIYYWVLCFQLNAWGITILDSY